MNQLVSKRQKQKRRHIRVRARIRGSIGRPRLAVFRSSKHIYAQVIDDATGRTLVSAADLKSKTAGKVARAKTVGETLAKLALGQKIKRVAFDRGGFLYAGRVKALAEGARNGGLEF